jgi:hypothetical protein
LFVGAAREFRFRVAFSASALMSVVFVRVVEAIVVSIADVNARNAVAVVASEQVSKTRFGARFAVIWRLISSVATIVVSVTIPSGRNAAVVVGTAETVARAGALRTGRIVLIRIVTAVIVSVAEPERFHANVGRIAFEMVRWASCVPRATIAGFIRRISVFAIIYSVANLKNPPSENKKKLI